MKIDSSTKATGATHAKEVREQRAPQRTGSPSDEVSLSSLASQLGATDDQPSFDAARVAEIKQAISDGRFTINAGAIADRLIASAKELINSQQHA